MDVVSTLLTMGATVGATGVGWSFGQLGQWFVYRRDRKRVLARALFGMLQTRDRLQGIPEAVRIMSQKLNMPAADQAILVAVLEQFQPGDPSTAEFDKSVATLAEYDPVLASSIVNKNQGIGLLRTFRQLVLADPGAADLWSRIEREVLTLVVPRLDRAILELGSRHSRAMETNIRAELESKASPEDDEKISMLLDVIIEEQLRRQAVEGAQSATATASAPSSPIAYPQPTAHTSPPAVPTADRESAAATSTQ